MATTLLLLLTLALLLLLHRRQSLLHEDLRRAGRDVADAREWGHDALSVARALHRKIDSQEKRLTRLENKAKETRNE